MIFLNRPRPFLTGAALVILLTLTTSMTPAGTLRAADPLPHVYLPVATGGREPVLVPLGEGFSVVTAVTHAGDERIFVVERGGRVKIYHPDGHITLFLDLSARVEAYPGEHGMFDLAFHPGYTDPQSPGHGFFYVAYTGLDGGEMYTFISRLRVSPGDGDLADPASETWLLKLRQFNDWHKGGELDFDPRDNSLYAGLGEDAQPPLSQQLDTPKGKIIRLAVDGVPAGMTGDAIGLVEPEFAAIGLRNPWRFDVDPTSGLIFIGDVGEHTWEEINILSPDEPGVNFGWPCREGPDPYALYANNHPICAADRVYRSPVAYHAHGDGHCAVIGGKVIRTSDDPAGGRFIYADACSHDVFSLSVDGSAAMPVRLGTIDVPGLITNIGEDAYGNLYVGNTASRGPIYRLILP